NRDRPFLNVGKLCQSTRAKRYDQQGGRKPKPATQHGSSNFRFETAVDALAQRRSSTITVPTSAMRATQCVMSGGSGYIAGLLRRSLWQCRKNTDRAVFALTA